MISTLRLAFGCACRRRARRARSERRRSRCCAARRARTDESRAARSAPPTRPRSVRGLRQSCARRVVPAASSVWSTPDSSASDCACGLATLSSAPRRVRSPRDRVPGCLTVLLDHADTSWPRGAARRGRWSQSRQLHFELHLRVHFTTPRVPSLKIPPRTWARLSADLADLVEFLTSYIPRQAVAPRLA